MQMLNNSAQKQKEKKINIENSIKQKKLKFQKINKKGRRNKVSKPKIVMIAIYYEYIYLYILNK